jgi:hypothetical protein
VLALARRLDIATNPAPEAVFEAGSAGFQIWCTPDDHPQGWEEVTLTAGIFSKPCGYVANVTWGWEVGQITHLLLETDSFDLKRKDRDLAYADIRNRPADVAWAKRKIQLLFQWARVSCPLICVEQE